MESIYLNEFITEVPTTKYQPLQSGTQTSKGIILAREHEFYDSIMKLAIRPIRIRILSLSLILEKKMSLKLKNFK